MQYEAQFSDLIVQYGVKRVNDITVPVCRPSSLQCCSENLFVYSSPKYIATVSHGIVTQYDYKLNAILFIEDLNLYAGITQGTPHLIFYDNIKGLPQFPDEFRIDMTMCEYLYYLGGKLLVLGTNLNVYDISISRSLERRDHPIEITKLFSLNFPQVKIFQQLFYDEFYNRFVIPTLHGFSVITLDGQVIYDDYNLTLNFAKSSTCFICKPKNFVNSTVQRDPFKKLAILNPDGSINIYNRILQLAKSISLPGVIFNYLEFISNQFIFLLTDFDIYILDIKTFIFLKVYSLKEKYEAISYNKDLKHLVLMSNTKIYSFSINIPWILWKSFTSSINLIKLQISSQTSPKICFLHENLFLTFVNPDTTKETSSIGISGRDQINNFIYDRGVVYENDQLFSTGTTDIPSFETMTEKIFIFRENFTIEQYQSIDESEFIHLNNIPVPTKAMCIGIYKEISCIYCVSKKGDLLVYKYENFEQLMRCKFKYTDVISIHYHYSTNRLFLAFQNCLIIFDPSSMTVIKDIPAKNVYLAEFEGSYLFLCNKEKVQIFNLQTDFDLCLEFPVSDKIKGVSLLKESFACYTSENMLIFGKPFQLIGRLKSPFEITSIYLLNPKFDILISVGKFVMIFHALEFYPYLYVQLPNSVSRRGQRILNKMSRKQSRKTQRSQKVQNFNEIDRNEILNEITAIENKGIKERNKEQANNKETIKKRMKIEEEEKRKQTEEKISMKFESRKQLKGILHHLLSYKDIPSEEQIDPVKSSKSQPVNLVLSNQTNGSYLAENKQNSYFFTTEINSQVSDEKKVFIQQSNECQNVQTPKLSSHNESPRTRRNKAFMKTLRADNDQNKLNSQSSEINQPNERKSNKLKEVINCNIEEETNDLIKERIKQPKEQINDQVKEGTKEIIKEGIKEQIKEGTKEQIKERTKDRLNEEINDHYKESINDQINERTNQQIKEEIKDKSKEGTNNLIKEKIKGPKEGINDQIKEKTKQRTNNQYKEEIIDKYKERTNIQYKEETNDKLKEETENQQNGTNDLTKDRIKDQTKKETNNQQIEEIFDQYNETKNNQQIEEILNYSKEENISKATLENTEQINQNKIQNCNDNSQEFIHIIKRKTESQNKNETDKKIEQNQNNEFDFKHNKTENTTMPDSKQLYSIDFNISNKDKQELKQNEIINQFSNEELQNNTVFQITSNSTPQNINNSVLSNKNKSEENIFRNYQKNPENKNKINNFDEYQEVENIDDNQENYYPIHHTGRRITYDGFIPDSKENESPTKTVQFHKQNALKRRYSVGQYQKGYSGILNEQELPDFSNYENVPSEDDIVTDAADLMSQIEMTNKGINLEYSEDLDMEYKKLPSLQKFEQPVLSKLNKFDLSPRRKFLTTPTEGETQIYSVNNIQPQERCELPRKVSFDPNGIPPSDPHQSPLYRVISNYKAPSRRNQRRSRVSRQTLMRMMFPSRKKQRTPLSPIGGRVINRQPQNQNQIMDLRLMKSIVNQNRQRKMRQTEQKVYEKADNQPLNRMFKIIQPKSENFSQKFFKRK